MLESTNGAVTVVGLGRMGAALAGAFLNGGHATTVWNRAAAKADPLVARGAVRATTTAEAFSASRLVVICVLDNDAVRQLLHPLAGKLTGRVLVNLSTGTPAEARELAGWAAGQGAEYLDWRRSWPSRRGLAGRGGAVVQRLSGRVHGTAAGAGAPRGMRILRGRRGSGGPRTIWPCCRACTGC